MHMCICMYVYIYIYIYTMCWYWLARTYRDSGRENTVLTLAFWLDFDLLNSWNRAFGLLDALCSLRRPSKAFQVRPSKAFGGLRTPLEAFEGLQSEAFAGLWRPSKAFQSLWRPSKAFQVRCLNALGDPWRPSKLFQVKSKCTPSEVQVHSKWTFRTDAMCNWTPSEVPNKPTIPAALLQCSTSLSMESTGAG